MSEIKDCTRCREREARHSVYKEQEERLCCFCNYADSGIASDWHPECMEAVAAANGGALPPPVVAGEKPSWEGYCAHPNAVTITDPVRGSMSGPYVIDLSPMAALKVCPDCGLLERGELQLG